MLPYKEPVELTIVKPFELPVPEWKWRTAQGEFIPPRDMVTRHLFYTLRMIWNNTMPPGTHVGRNIRYYRFGPHYSESYLGDAIRFIGGELFTRPDLQQWQKLELEQMARLFEKHKLDKGKPHLSGGYSGYLPEN